MNANTCTICGNEHDELFELTIGHTVHNACRDCAEAEGFVECRDCGEWVHKDNAYSVGDEYICESCRDSGYETCEDCGELFPIGEGNIINRNTRGEFVVCDECLDGYTQCDDCGDYFTDGYLRSDHTNAVCDHCYDWHDWHVCDNCGSLTQSGEWVNDDEDFYCESCLEETRTRLNNYSYKPTPVFHFRRSETTLAERAQCEPRSMYLTFGAELEVDHGNSVSDAIRDLADLDAPIYMKRDGSLDNGIEIVTHPCSLAYHAYELRWTAIVKACEKHDFKSHDTSTCGLHIHVGRAGMGKTVQERDATAAKLVLLVRTLWPELVKFSRRETSRLEEWAMKPTHWLLEEKMEALNNGTAVTEAELLDCALRTKSNGRYQAANLQNASTVEFRLFRGTLKRETLIASIQLVNNLTKYAMAHNAFECLTATWSDVLAVEQFKELKAYCEARGI